EVPEGSGMPIDKAPVSIVVFPSTNAPVPAERPFGGTCTGTKAEDGGASDPSIQASSPPPWPLSGRGAVVSSPARKLQAPRNARKIDRAGSIVPCYRRLLRSKGFMTG